ncbi:MAG: hypothetical protein IAG13_34960, partial [Deltaproteobacteria bacterium]|nr:hypothetical protein [Nannocystaceae bacterium]
MLAALVACSSTTPSSGDSTTAAGTTGADTTTGEPGTTSSAGTDTTSVDDSTSDSGSDTGPPPDPAVITLIDEAIYYDGYAPLVDEPVPEGLIRVANSLYATRFTEE